jgi:Skp family chaperone for outer membrane proteins
MDMMPPMEDLSRLTQARSLLILLLATCKQTQLALEVAANLLDTGLSRDLEAMIERSEGELKKMNAKIEALSAT